MYKNEKEFQSDYIKQLKENGYWVYKFPDIGYTLKPVIDAMQKWGKEYKRLRKLMEQYGG